MQQGSSFHWISEEAIAQPDEGGRVRFANNPLQSEHTQLIAAALTSGFRLLEPGGFRDTLEQDADGVTRRVEWFIDGSSRGVFRTPALGEESLDFAEFRRRFQSQQWCLENPDHPISFLRWGFAAHNRLREHLRQLKPAALLRRGNRQAIIPAGLPEEQRQQLLSFINQ